MSTTFTNVCVEYFILLFSFGGFTFHFSQREHLMRRFPIKEKLNVGKLATVSKIFLFDTSSAFCH